MRSPTYCYSDLSIDKYRITTLDDCEVRAIEQMGEKTSIWNMFWLSLPRLDLIPGAGTEWAKVYWPVDKALATIACDVTLDPVLKFKVRMHPRVFMSWFEREDHTIYDAYELFGGDEWVETVLIRALAAARRIDSSVPRRRVGNVYPIEFARAKTA